MALFSLPSFSNLGQLPQFSLSIFWVHALAFLFHLVNFFFLSLKMHEVINGGQMLGEGQASLCTQGTLNASGWVETSH